MVALFRVALFCLGLACATGYGALLFAAALGPVVQRLEPADASAVAQAAYRAGARRNEAVLYAVGPLALAAVALSDGRIAWSAPWVWTALGAWAVSMIVRDAVMQPARRAALVMLGEAAGSRLEADARRAQLYGLSRRLQLGALSCSVLFAIALAAVIVQPGG